MKTAEELSGQGIIAPLKCLSSRPCYHTVCVLSVQDADRDQRHGGGSGGDDEGRGVGGGGGGCGWGVEEYVS